MKTICLLHELYCWFSLCLFFPCYYYGGPFLFVVQTIFGGGLACVIDWYISPTFHNNVTRIIQRRLSPSSPLLLFPTSQWWILLNVYVTLFTSESIAVALVVATGGYDVPCFWRLDTRFVVNIAVSIVVGEAVFTLAHRYFLHGTQCGAHFHEIHHTCRPSSFSTSFLFHFCDSMTEFTLTHASMALFSHYVLQDPASLLCTIQITYLWYTVVGHSENLQLPHYYHHQWISANYTAYFPHNPAYFKTHYKDCVRELLDQKKRQETELILGKDNINSQTIKNMRQQRDD